MHMMAKNRLARKALGVCMCMYAHTHTHVHAQMAKDRAFRKALDEFIILKEKKAAEKRREEERLAAAAAAQAAKENQSSDLVEGAGASKAAASISRPLTHEERVDKARKTIDELDMILSQKAEQDAESKDAEESDVASSQDNAQDEQLASEAEQQEEDYAGEAMHLSLALPGSTVEWDMRFTREFKDAFFSIRSRRSLLNALIRTLQRIASGEREVGLVQALTGTPRDLRIFQSPILGVYTQDSIAPVVVWQVAADYSPRTRCYSDTIRLWALAWGWEEAKAAAQTIVESHKRGRSSSVKQQLRPTGGQVLDPQRTLPCNYEMVECGNSVSEIREWEESIKQLVQLEETRFKIIVGAEDEKDWRPYDGPILYTPPAIASADSYNVLKFYRLDDAVLQSIMALPDLARKPAQGGARGDQLAGAVVPLPDLFIPDEREDDLIQQDIETRTSSMLLVGRSGTGKTSIAVGRMWALFRHWHSQAAEDQHSDAMLRQGFNQVFVTGNRVLRDQVRKSFTSMKQCFLKQYGVPVMTQYPASFNGVTNDMFPMFLTQTEWLLMLDCTLQDPFFPRNPDGTPMYAVQGGFHEEVGMLDNLDDLSDAEDDWLAEEEDEDDMYDDNDNAQNERAQQGERSLLSTLIDCLVLRYPACSRWRRAI
jgi:hypothetical protein